jgi:hypothetical protein
VTYYLRETLNRVRQTHHYVSYGSEDCICRTSCVILLGLCDDKAACSPGMFDPAIGVGLATDNFISDTNDT